jgi:hypothetical protein
MKNDWKQIFSWQIATNEFYELEKLLNKKHYSYHLEGNTFVIDHEGNVDIGYVKSLPDNVQFNNEGFVNLFSLKSLLPNNIQFNNKRNVYFYSLTSLPDNKYEIFKNEGIVYYNNYNSMFNPRDREKLSWQEPEIGDDIIEIRKNSELMEALTRKGIPFNILKQTGGMDGIFIRKGNNQIFTGYGFNGYFVDVKVWKTIQKDTDNLNKILDTIEEELEANNN